MGFLCNKKIDRPTQHAAETDCYSTLGMFTNISLDMTLVCLSKEKFER